MAEPKPAAGTTPRSDIDEFQRQDLRIKWLTLLVTFLGFAGTIATIYIQFEGLRSQESTQLKASAEQAIRDAEARAQEYKKQFFEKQLDFFAEACQVTGTLTYAAVNSPEFTQAQGRFEELYWGRLAIVESNDVAGEMVKFREALPTLLSAVNDEEKEKVRRTLRYISLDLAHSCRDAASANFKIDLQALPLTELRKGAASH